MYHPVNLFRRSRLSESGVRRCVRPSAFLRLLPVLICLTYAPFVDAVDPPPDGGYPDETTAEGEDALFSWTPGRIGGNTALGFQALYSTTTGSNTAVGDSALHDNTTGAANTATGYFTLHNNTTGVFNTGNGDFVLVANTTGSFNTATGAEAMVSNSTGSDNVANGYVALTFNTIGNYNTAIGAGALAFNSTGSENTAVGFSALNPLTTGTGNIALGKLAGAKLTTENNNIDIGNQGVAGESSTIRIGNKLTQRNTYIAGINGVTVTGGVAVVVDGKGHLGTSTSSAQYKEKIKPMEKASEAILSLEPVTFRYKHDLDPDGIPQFGLVAEQVARVNPNLVARDEEGKPYTVRYEAVNAMLLNEFLKEHHKVERLEVAMAQEKKSFESALAQQQQQINALRTSLKEQAARRQKVNAGFQASKPAPQLVLASE